MNYRRFGQLDWQASALGFGCMRLPLLENTETIDEPQATRMLRDGIDQGINYIDTAYPYHNGQSEPFVGRALMDGYRQKVHLATKMPTWLTKTYQDFDKFLDEQLARLQTDHIDFYLLHALNQKRWDELVALNVCEWAEKAIASGKIGAIGFSFHDMYPAFSQILNDYDRWTFCQIQYNYLDIEEQAGRQGLRDAAARGLAVVVMEPLLGGKLANPPEPVVQLLDVVPTRRSPADWALQWLWDQPEVTLVLSGMSTPEQVEQNLSSASRSRVGSFTSEDQAVIHLVREKYNEIVPIPCTKCAYCLPCPNGVNIPWNFELFNKGAMMGQWESSQFRYHSTPVGESADNCIQCNECLEKCPQSIAISTWLPYVHEVLGKHKDYDGRKGAAGL